MENEMKKQYELLLQKYKVNHLLNEHKKFIFVLESPHIDELLNGAPVSGLSGKAMSKVLFGENEKRAMGIVLKENTSSPIGIMNICSIPMQRVAYVNEEVVASYGEFDVENYQEFFDVLEKLRVGTKPTYKDEVKTSLQQMILANFQKELEALKEKELVFIPCGKTAETFFSIAGVHSDKWTVLDGVPHPSFGNWHKQKYTNVINEVKKIVK